MKPGKRNIAVTRGDDYTQQISFVDDAGDPVDKTGCSYLAQTRPSATATDALAVDFDVDDSQLAAGVLVVSLDAAVTRDLPTVGVWDLQQTAPGPDVTTILAGSMVVSEDVTR